MSLSDTLAALNVARYATWSADTADARQAIMAFNGDVYARPRCALAEAEGAGWTRRTTCASCRACTACCARST